MVKPIVYISSPYTKGDAGLNTRFQMKVWDRLLTDGMCLPYAPLMTHFQHICFPRPYQDWIDFDLEFLRAIADTARPVAMLRLNAREPDLNYLQCESSGADKEVALFKELNRPVFWSITDLNEWLQKVRYTV